LYSKPYLGRYIQLGESVYYRDVSQSLTQWRTQKIFMAYFIQWHRIVICIWCALIVTSQFDVIVLVPNQRFVEVC